jgi:hypothetical protein
VKLYKSEEYVPSDINIESKPNVHFTPYDTVFDHTNPNVSEIRYSPKISVEDKTPSNWGFDDDIPKLVISNSDDDQILGPSDIIDLDMSISALPNAESLSITIPEPIRAPSPTVPEPIRAPSPVVPEPIRAPSPAVPEPIRAPSPAAPEPIRAPTPVITITEPTPIVISNNVQIPVTENIDIDIPLTESNDFEEL